MVTRVTSTSAAISYPAGHKSEGGKRWGGLSELGRLHMFRSIHKLISLGNAASRWRRGTNLIYTSDYVCTNRDAGAKLRKGTTKESARRWRRVWRVSEGVWWEEEKRVRARPAKM